MTDDLATEIARSNMPAPNKSAIMRFYERMGGGVAIKRHVSETAQAVRQGGESAIMGGLLGLIEAEHGSLDVKFQGKTIPIDGSLALLGLFGSVVMANDPTGLSADIRNLSSASLAVFSYRKGKEWREKGKGLTHALPGHHGEQNIPNDPILAAAQRFTR
jgi:hypothetical protein